jgi:hypothetical protein
MESPPMKILVMDPLFETVPDVEEQAAGSGRGAELRPDPRHILDLRLN